MPKKAFHADRLQMPHQGRQFRQRFQCSDPVELRLQRCNARLVRSRPYPCSSRYSSPIFCSFGVREGAGTAACSRICSQMQAVQFIQLRKAAVRSLVGRQRMRLNQPLQLYDRSCRTGPHFCRSRTDRRREVRVPGRCGRRGLAKTAD